MTLSPNSREIKMLLHLISISIFSVPITTHILKLALKQTFRIGSFEFENLHSILLIILILLIISANIISIVTDRGHKISMFITGGFLFAVTVIQIDVLILGTSMEVFGGTWPRHVSIIETSITGTFSALLLLSAVFIKKEKPQATTVSRSRLSIPTIKNGLKKLQDYVVNMESRLAFLLGIASSMILVVPICGLLYLAAHLLLDASFLPPANMKFLAWIGIVGMQGSIISMLLGLRRFKENLGTTDSLGLFLNALVRPFIGFSFAHLSFFMLESGLLQDGSRSIPTSAVGENGLMYGFNYHVSIAFIAGFTERIAKVIQPGPAGTKEVPTTGMPADNRIAKKASVAKN